MSSEKCLMEGVILPLAKYKNQLISLNNVSKWQRYSAKKVKDEYKQMLKDFYLVENENDAYKTLTVKFEIIRHNNRKFDADNGAYSYKWIIDTLVELGWLLDDDQVRYEVEPSIVNSSLKDTSVRVSIYER